VPGIKIAIDTAIDVAIDLSHKKYGERPAEWWAPLREED
jgi:hypothetical protein